MKCFKIVGAVTILAGACLSSEATILPPGGTGLDAPQAPGTTILDTLVTPFSFGGIDGTVTSWVVSDPSNPLGGLSFYYQVSNTGTEGITRLSTSDFGISPGALVDVSTIAGAFDSSVSGGILPTIANRSSGPGTTVGFNFFNNILSGQSSVVLVVNTGYSGFQISAGSVIDSSSVNVNILGPVPEPSTFMAAGLLLIPLGASTLRILRRR